MVSCTLVTGGSLIITHPEHVKDHQFYQKICRAVKGDNVTNHSMQNKTSGSKIMSKLYLFLPFLPLDQEFHHVLAPPSHPLVQDFLGILEGLKKKKWHSKRGLTSHQWPNMNTRSVEFC